MTGPVQPGFQLSPPAYYTSSGLSYAVSYTLQPLPWSTTGHPGLWLAQLSPSPSSWAATRLEVEELHSGPRQGA